LPVKSFSWHSLVHPVLYNTQQDFLAPVDLGDQLLFELTLLLL
jgi:hypothetical protein